ncbi:hypothetical protein NDN08_006528 [Rhodosorus marinus]|uniref:Uncharacterized protein n=1 Tax=Rhodosorus marinus TaxID=101924 RepID=A0AAV8UHW3_9RHOD|nr:hypothetical protein NDN08_006528 [Rhodosorus marinus]
MRRSTKFVLSVLVALIAACLNGLFGSEKFTRIDLRALDSVNSKFEERVVACMPTVSRPKGASYVDAAARTFREVTRNSPYFRRLVIFVMDLEPQKNVVVQRLKRASKARAHSWLTVLDGERRHAKDPTRREHGDPPDRITWRSKEALDYAETLERCIEIAGDVSYILVVQDDVTFGQEFKDIAIWADRLHRRPKSRICALSLFDISQRVDSKPEKSSNMVAKLYKPAVAKEFVDYARSMFDHSPIDWLHRDFCAARNLQILVKYPNPIDHKGVVSTFERNKRETMSQ